MSLSFTVARIFGIPLRIHALFAALVIVCLATGARAGRGEEVLVLLGILFGSVLLHELGHSLVARRLGARVVDITLWPLGGLSRMSSPASRPRDEAIVALAGPATNFVLFLAALPFGARVRIDAWATAPLDAFATVNAALALFNLAPAFPMDGGRALRAALAMRLGEPRATVLAVRVGRIFTVAALIASLAVENLFLPVAIVSVFLFGQGWIELERVRAR
ncbi:MAG TPA: site-2 protease family protein [Planctomycetota bacterium]|nr:site-2 protease family protein [Planctomycetota bacterium]